MWVEAPGLLLSDKRSALRDEKTLKSCPSHNIHSALVTDP